MGGKEYIAEMKRKLDEDIAEQERLVLKMARDHRREAHRLRDMINASHRMEAELNDKD